MKKIKIGILGTASIAFNRFLPALIETDEFEYVGVASRNIGKTERFIEKFGGRGYASYETLIEDEEVNALYIPLPPHLHAEYAIRAITKGKHVFLEKPFTLNEMETNKVIEEAKKYNVAVHENYMFLFHRQMLELKKYITNKEIGEIRHIRTAFTFPNRGRDDFRYNPKYGGGSLLDCGGYTLALANFLLPDAKVVYSNLRNLGYEVDVIGHVIMRQKDIEADLLFGMDQCYRCEVEIYGSTGSVKANRVYTAPSDFEVELELFRGNEKEIIYIGRDNHFKNSLLAFSQMINDEIYRDKIQKQIITHSSLIDCCKR